MYPTPFYILFFFIFQENNIFCLFVCLFWVGGCNCKFQASRTVFLVYDSSLRWMTRFSFLVPWLSVVKERNREMEGERRRKESIDIFLFLFRDSEQPTLAAVLLLGRTFTTDDVVVTWETYTHTSISFPSHTFSRGVWWLKSTACNSQNIYAGPHILTSNNASENVQKIGIVIFCAFSFLLIIDYYVFYHIYFSFKVAWVF